MSYWREAGLTFLDYSAISAKTLRNVLKTEPKIQALKREEQYAKIAQWKNGKQQENKIMLEYTTPALLLQAQAAAAQK